MEYTGPSLSLHVRKARTLTVKLLSVAFRLIHTRSRLITVCVMANLAAVAPAKAQSGPETTEAAAPTASVVQQDDDVLNPAEPDFVVVNLPTTLRLPLFKSNFRLTHRFAGNLRSGSFSQQAGNLFGIDQGAIIGFEYRFAPLRHVQAAFYRSSFEKTIQFYGKYDGIRQRGALPVSVSPLVSIEGTNNFKDKFAPAAGVVISRRFSTRAAVYFTPVWAGNTAASLKLIEHQHDDHGDEHAVAETHLARRNTFYTGIGARYRIGGSSYVAAEVVIRARGYAPDRPAYGFSLEKRAGGHMFSLTFTNTFGTTLAQVARGGAANSLYLGFNLGRKFF